MEVPESTEDLLYFTRRTSGNGNVIAWVHKQLCPKCKKALMGKPVEKGKVKLRAKEYVCPSCGNAEEKAVYEPQLTMEVMYTCPYCKKSGETTTLYERKTLDGVPSYIFTCVDCGKKVGISKKMKQKRGDPTDTANDDTV